MERILHYCGTDFIANLHFLWDKIVITRNPVGQSLTLIFLLLFSVGYVPVISSILILWFVLDFLCILMMFSFMHWAQVRNCIYLIGPFYAGQNLMPALVTPEKKYGLPPLWTTVYAIQKSMIVENDKALHYS